MWPSKPDLFGQIVKIGWKMANGQLLFQALNTYYKDNKYIARKYYAL